MGISAVGYAGLEALINGCLALDPQAGERIGQLHGRVIGFQVLGLGANFFLIPGPGRVQLLAHHEGDPDCVLRGAPLALARMIDRRESADQLFSGEVQITGDTELAHLFGKILAEMDVDWEEQLSHLTGDIVAHKLGNLVRDAGHWGTSALETMGMNLQEYLQQELQLLPVRWEIEGFLSDVDRLRDDSERLQARIALLRTRLGETR